VKRAFARFSHTVVRKNFFAIFHIRCTCVPFHQNTHSRKIYEKLLDLRQTALWRTCMLIRSTKEKMQNIRRERFNH